MLAQNNLSHGEISWQEELRTALKTQKEVEDFFNLIPTPCAYPSFIPLKLAQKIKQAGNNSSLWKQFLPSVEENNFLGGHHDPTGDHLHFKMGQLVHRYDNRALFMVTQVCPVQCRYCFRKNELSDPDFMFTPQWDLTVQYLNQHPEIEEIIFTGGDPLMLSDQKLLHYFQEFAKIPHLKFIRLHTRMPIVIPSRITAEFLQVLQEGRKLFEKLIIAIHANHLDELDPEVQIALTSLTQNHSPVLSQSVLLKNVNDQPQVLKELFMGLTTLNIRPYYLHHPDPVRGGMHFYLSTEEGKSIFKNLRRIVPGWALPQYICDDPSGSGKFALS